VIKKLTLAALLGLFALPMAACENESDAEDAIEDAAEDVEDATEEAGDDMEDALDGDE
jgi:hypothetical protein